MKTILRLPLIGDIPRAILTVSIVGTLAFTACERKSTSGEPALPRAADPVASTTSFETERLGAAIDLYEKAPTAENQASVTSAFAKLDGEIAELQGRAAKTDGSDRADAVAKLNNLQLYRDAEMIRFTKAQGGAALGANPPADGRSAAQKVGDTIEQAGENAEDAAKRVGRTLENAARNTGDAIKDAAP